MERIHRLWPNMTFFLLGKSTVCYKYILPILLGKSTICYKYILPIFTNYMYALNYLHFCIITKILYCIMLTNNVLGDSGYPLRPWLLTPIADAEANSLEERYNRRQMSCRALIERCNGILKMRFRCLLKHRVLHYTPQVACKIINACAVLHNICIENNVPLPHDEQQNEWQDDLFNQCAPGDNEEIRNIVNPELAAGKRLRRKLINNYFA